MNLNELAKLDFAGNATNSIANKVRSLSISKIHTFAQLRTMLNNDENKLIDWLLNIKPADVGVETPFCGIDEPSSDTNFHILHSTKAVHKDDGSVKTYRDTNYVPDHIWKQWTVMNQAIVSDGLNELVIMSAYRSPAYQTALICYRLSHYLDSPLSVFTFMSLPGYSQHGLIQNCAIDLLIDDSFTVSGEYNWMLEHAAEYGFKLSYPQDNPDGIIFEPWHWQYVGLNK